MVFIVCAMEKNKAENGFRCVGGGKLVSESIVIDKIVFERSPEEGEGASHVGIQRKRI